MAKIDVHELARRGAMARLRELQEEAEQLYARFPDLLDKKAAVVPAVAASRAEPRPKAPRKYSMSQSMRKTVSRRMKAYWAARRAEKARKR